MSSTNLIFFSFFFVLISLNAYHPHVEELKNYVETNQTFANDVTKMLSEAATELGLEKPKTLTDFYTFWDEWITIAPLHNDSFLDTLVDYSRTESGNSILLLYKSQEWIAKWNILRKQYCDSYESVESIPKWTQWDRIDMNEYVVPEGGFQSFNQFFARHIKEGARTVQEPENDDVFTSPCDGEVTNINLNNLTIPEESETCQDKDKDINRSKFYIKNNEYDICAILGGECKDYVNGTSIQIFLDTFNYHRYHSATRGYVTKVNFLGGTQILFPLYGYNDSWPWASFFPNNHIRGLLFLDNPKHGEIAHVFVGLDIVSSVAIDVKPSLFVNKGDNVGAFMYGGSTIVLFF